MNRPSGKLNAISARIARLLRDVLFSILVFMPYSVLAGEAPQTTPQVVVSILPVHSLVSGVMQGVEEPSLIVTGYGSPHTYRMRPSDATKLHNADLVFWIGGTLETFLRKPLSSLPNNVRVISLLETEGLILLENREGGLWEHHTLSSPSTTQNTSDHHISDPVMKFHGHVHHAHEQAILDNSPGTTESTRLLGYNPHIWLDPENVKKLVKAISYHLSEVDPIHAAHYQANEDNLLQRIDKLARKLDKQLSGLASVPYLVFHDAFLYLEKRYGLQAAGSITVSPDRMPSARRITQLRTAMQDLDIRCVFQEPQFNTKIIKTALDGTNARISTLDPLGVTIEPGPDLWFQVMNIHSETMVSCLSGL